MVRKGRAGSNTTADHITVLDQALQPCGCRKFCPHRSGGMIVFMEEAAEAIVSADAQTGERRRIDERFGQRLERSGVSDVPVRPVVVMVAFALAQGV